MYRQKKLGNPDEQSDEESVKMPESPPKLDEEIQSGNAEASSTSPAKSLKLQEAEVIETPPKSPRPEAVVSSSLSCSPNKDRQMSKAMAILSQIFPGKPSKILENKLRESRGDVVKALEACAKHFDHVIPTNHQPSNHSSSPYFRENNTHQQLTSAVAALPESNNNNSQSNDSAKFSPPFSTAAMAAMALATSSQAQQHKSAFFPATAASSANQHSAFYRGFDPPSFFPKELFPFPPPLFPPSFFVGFSSNHPPPTYHHTPPAGLAPFNLSAVASADNHVHRPCVDPLCSQCAPKVDSTEESSIKEDGD